jgi:nucleoside phosphorylase
MNPDYEKGQAPMNVDSKADMLIITVTKPEHTALMQVFQEKTRVQAKPERIKDRIYHNLGELNGTRVYMAISEMGTAGIGASLPTVQKAIEALSPAAVVLVGIAFGINDKKHAIGDVLVSKQLWLYELQRRGDNATLTRGDKVSASGSLLIGFATQT